MRLVSMRQQMYFRKGNYVLRIPQLKLHTGHTVKELETAIRKELRLNSNAQLQYRIRRRSIDARKKQEIHYVYMIDVSLETKEEKRILAKAKCGITAAPKEEYRFTPCGEKNFIRVRLSSAQDRQDCSARIFWQSTATARLS